MQSQGGVFGAVGGVAGCAVFAAETGGGGEDDEVAGGEVGGLRGGAEADDAPCACEVVSG